MMSGWSIEAHPGDPWVVLECEDRPPVRLRLGRTAEGRVACIALCLEAAPGSEVTAGVLRSLPLASVLARVGRLLGDDGSPLAAISGALVLPEWSAPHRKGPRGWPPEHYARVMERWEAHGRRTARVAAELNASPATVRRWLARARRNRL